jgi:outer membrane protein insertion porin family
MRPLPVLIVAGLLVPALAAAQQPPPVSPLPVQAPSAPAPAAQAPAAPAPGQPQTEITPPSGSPTLLRAIEVRFSTQGNVSVIDPQTYVYYIQTQTSRPSAGVWIPYTEATEQTLLSDYKRLWGTSFLDNLTLTVEDRPYSNGVAAKYVVFDMEERQRVKIVDYDGSKKVEITKIDEALKEKNAVIRTDSFIDQGLVRRVSGIVRELYAEKGYQYAEVKPTVKEMAGGPKLIHLTFNITEGPKVEIRDIDFVGNVKMSDGSLEKKMKENKGRGFFSFITGGGTFKEAKFEEDAEKVVEHYRNEGYIAAQVGQPELKVLEDSKDGRTRHIQLRVPVTEGARYRVGDFKFEGNTVVKEEALRPLFKMKSGDWYAEKRIRKGLEKAREIFGSGGYYEFVGFPDLKPRDLSNGNGNTNGKTNDGADGAANDKPNGKPRPGAAPIVDVTMRMQPGKQYFVNRITFVGNTTTRDNVIRRELRLYEGGVFNTEGLKSSIKRLNQLGYFKSLEGGEAIDVQKTPGTQGVETSEVDVTLKLEEQNRNQLTFGAGVSQFEGFFGQLSFQTANFLGRGETLTVAAQAGSRARNYQVAFTEPFLFDRPITLGFDIYTREVRYISQFTQASIGGNLVFGFPLADFTRMFLSYSYEQVKVKELNELYLDPILAATNPFLADSLLLGVGGHRTISKIAPSLVHNTVDSPIFPTTGRRYTASFDLAGLGGNTPPLTTPEGVEVGGCCKFYNPRLEGIWYFRHTNRTSLGFRGQWEFISPYGDSNILPIFERLFLGGEYSVRGFDIRTIGPYDSVSGLVIGGNKSLLFNGEYLINIAGPVRLVLFYDAGQVQDRGDKFAMDDFKTSTGAEIRFFMPVLNVPFRLIFAWNPQRDGVLDNQLQPQKAFTFRFAVGSTF